MKCIKDRLSFRSHPYPNGPIAPSSSATSTASHASPGKNSGGREGKNKRNPPKELRVEKFHIKPSKKFEAVCIENAIQPKAGWVE